MQQVVLNPSSARTSKTESLQIPDEMQNYVLQPSVLKISCAATTPTATIEPNRIRFPSPTPPFRLILPPSHPTPTHPSDELATAPCLFLPFLLLSRRCPFGTRSPSLTITLHPIFRISLQHLLTPSIFPLAIIASGIIGEHVRNRLG